MSKKIISASVISVAFIAVVLLTSPGPVFASTNGIMRGKTEKMMHSNLGKTGINGTTTSISGGTIIIKAKNGTVYTVDASNATIIRDRNTKIQLSDVKTGDVLIISGAANGTSITANRILDVPQLAFKNMHFAGTVSSVSRLSFTLQSKNGKTVTVNAGLGTVFTKDGQPASFSALTTGQEVRVAGTLDNSNNTVNATSVRIVSALNMKLRAGTVQSISGNTLTVLSRNQKTYAVDATNAKITTKNGQSGSVSSIQTNDKITVSGKLTLGTTNIIVGKIRDLSR